jgi:hypothetical protein
MEAENIAHLGFREQTEMGIHLIGVPLNLYKQNYNQICLLLASKAHICKTRVYMYHQFDVDDLTRDLPRETEVLRHVLLSHLIGRRLHLKST